MYLDPPYYVKGGDLYENHYLHDDHVAIAGEVQALDRPWIVTYDDVPAIRRMYPNKRRRTFSLRYSAQTRYAGREVVFFSDRLVVPAKVSPSRSIAN